MAGRNISNDEIKWILSVDAQGAQAGVQKFSSEIDRLKKENNEYAAANKATTLEIKEMEKALKSLEKQGKQNGKEYQSLSAKIAASRSNMEEMKRAVNENNKSIGEQNKKIEEAIKTMDVQDMTMSQLRQRAAELQKQMDHTSQSLSPDAYKKLQKELGAVKDRMGVVQNSGKSLAQQFSSIPGPIGMASRAVTGIGTALKTLAANPIGAIIMIIVAAFTALKNVINSNEKSINLLNQILAPLKRLLEWILDIVQKLVNSFLEFVQVAMQGVTWLLSKIPFLKNAMESLNESARAAIQLEKDKQALVRRGRELLVANSQREKEIAELRWKSAQKDLHSNKERLGYLEEASRLEKEISNTKVEAAAEALRIAEEEASRSENSAETEDNLAQLRANRINAETEYFQTTKRLEGEMSSLRMEMQREQQAAAEATARKRIEASQKAQEATAKATQKQLENIDYALNQEINALKKSREEGLVTETEYNEKVHRLNVEALEKKKQVKGQERSQMQKYESQILDEQLTLQQDTDKLLLQELKKTRDDQLAILETSRNEKIEALKDAESDQKIHAIRLQEIEATTAAAREAVFRQFAETLQKAEFQNAQNRVDIAAETQREILKAESESLKERRELQRKFTETTAGFDILYNIKSWEQRHNDELALLKRYRDENLMNEETYQAALEAVERKYRDEKLRARQQAVGTKIRELYDIELENLNLLHEQKLLSETEYEEAVLRMRLKYAAQYAQMATEYISQASGIVADLMQAETTNVETRYDAEIAAAGNNKEEVERLEREKAKKKLEIEKKYADVQFAITAAQIIASTAMSVMQAFAQLGPIAGAIAGAIVAAAGIAQLLVANAQRKKVKSMTLEGGGDSTPPPTGKVTMREGLAEGGYSADYSGGGYTTPGAKYSHAGWIPVHSGEYVVASNELARPDVADKVRYIEGIRRERVAGRRAARSGGMAEGGYNPSGKERATAAAERKAVENLTAAVQKLLAGDIVVNYGITEMEACQRRKQEVESIFTSQ